MKMAAILILILCFSSSSASFFGEIKTQIIGGEKATKCEFPSMALIKFYTMQNSYFCGGVLIDDRHVLTAATCFHPHVRKVQVSLGITKLSERGIVRRGAIVTPHRKFNMVNSHNDIALITLDHKVRTTRCVKPIALPKPGQVFDHLQCVTAGWGQTSVSSVKNSNDLMKAQLPIIPLGDCQKSMFYIEFSRQQICAGDLSQQGPGICSGDQGGPLLCPDGWGNQVLAGISSFNYGCHDPATIFTSIPHYLDWIENQNKTSQRLITRRHTIG